jgi:hypothetical protein
MDTFLPEGFNEIFNTRIRAVLVAYAKALEDPKFVCPSHLHAALEGLRRG